MNPTTTGIESLAGAMKEKAEQIVKEHHDLYLPLNKRNVIVLTPEISIATAYIKLFGSGKSYNNSTSFTNECYNRAVLEGLIEENPLVLITSVRLPIDLSGKFKNVEWENNEGINLARRIREGIAQFPKDVPILFYSLNNGDDERRQIEEMEGVVAYSNKPVSTHLKENIEERLYSAANRMFESKYSNLKESEATLHSVFQLIKNN